MLRRRIPRALVTEVLLGPTDLDRNAVRKFSGSNENVEAVGLGQIAISTSFLQNWTPDFILRRASFQPVAFPAEDRPLLRAIGPIVGESLVGLCNAECHRLLTSAS